MPYDDCLKYNLHEACLGRICNSIHIKREGGINTDSEYGFSSAVAEVYGNQSAPRLEGTVWFTDTSEGVRVDAQVTGLPPGSTGFYGFHVHAAGKCQQPDFSDAMGHYNPGNTQHPAHAGDLPPLLATVSGKAWLSFVTTRFTVKDIIGRSVIIHGARDDFSSQPAGDSGMRIGCGIIRAL